jgi:hypothetical protein
LDWKFDAFICLGEDSCAKSRHARMAAPCFHERKQQYFFHFENQPDWSWYRSTMTSTENSAAVEILLKKTRNFPETLMEHHYLWSIGHKDRPGASSFLNLLDHQHVLLGMKTYSRAPTKARSHLYDLLIRVTS